MKSESMPKLIPYLDQFSINQTLRFCLTNINDAVLVEPVGTLQLMKLTDLAGGFYFLYGQNRIFYVVRYRKVELPLVDSNPQRRVIIQAGRQVLVWRNRAEHSALSAGIAKRVFWTYLFPQYKCLVTDSQQTPDGKYFWEFNINEALHKKLQVMVLDTNTGSQTQLQHVSELDSISDQVWGTLDWFHRMVIYVLKPVVSQVITNLK